METNNSSSTSTEQVKQQITLKVKVYLLDKGGRLLMGVCVDGVTDRNLTGQDNKTGVGSNLGTRQSGDDVRVDLDVE